MREIVMWKWYPTNHVSMEQESSISENGNSPLWALGASFLKWGGGANDPSSPSALQFSADGVSGGGYDLWPENSHLLIPYLPPQNTLLCSSFPVRDSQLVFRYRQIPAQVKSNFPASQWAGLHLSRRVEGKLYWNVLVFKSFCSWAWLNMRRA